MLLKIEYIIIIVVFLCTVSWAMNNKIGQIEAQNEKYEEKNGQNSPGKRRSPSRKEKEGEEASSNRKKSTKMPHSPLSKSMSIDSAVSSVASIPSDVLRTGDTNANSETAKNKKDNKELELQIKEQQQQIVALQHKMERLMQWRHQSEEAKRQQQQLQQVQATAAGQTELLRLQQQMVGHEQQQGQGQHLHDHQREQQQGQDQLEHDHQLDQQQVQGQLGHDHQRGQLHQNRRQLCRPRPLLTSDRPTEALLRLLQQSDHSQQKQLPPPQQHSSAAFGKGVEVVGEDSPQPLLICAKTPKTPRANSLSELKKQIVAKLENMNFPSHDTEYIVAPNLERVEQMVRRAAMESIKAIKLSPEAYGFKEGTAEIMPSMMNVVNATKLVQKIDEMKSFSDRKPLIDLKSKIGDERIQQILEETEAECVSLEKHMEEAKGNSSGHNERKLLKHMTFMIAYARFYDKLLNLLNSAIGSAGDQKQQKSESDGRKVINWLGTMSEGIKTKLRMESVFSHYQKAYEWYAALLCLEGTIEFAKLAILIAFPKNVLNEWMKRGGKWAALKRVMKRINLETFIAYYDKKTLLEKGNDHVDQIRKHLNDWSKSGMMFSDYNVQKLAALIGKSTRKAMESNEFDPEMIMMIKLTIFMDVFRLIIDDLKGKKNDLIQLDKIRKERQNAQEFLEICLSLWSAKFVFFMEKMKAKIEEMDRIRKGRIFGFDERA